MTDEEKLNRIKHMHYTDYCEMMSISDTIEDEAIRKEADDICIRAYHLAN